MVIDKETKEPVVRTHIHVPLAGEPAYGGQGGSGWTTPVLRAQDGGKPSSETRWVLLVKRTQGFSALKDSSLKSFQSTTSKKQGGSSFKTRNKSTETLPSQVNRAIPGPGEEIESDPDAGVVDSEKVSVVFLVS